MQRGREEGACEQGGLDITATSPRPPELSCQPPGAARGASEEHSPAGTLSLDFQLPGPPDLGDDVLATQAMVLWYGCPRKPRQAQ